MSSTLLFVAVNNYATVDTSGGRPGKLHSPSVHENPRRCTALTTTVDTHGVFVLVVSA